MLMMTTMTMTILRMTTITNYFVALVRDELRLKYKGNRILRYADKPEEAKAIIWLKVQMGWHLTELNWPRNS